MTAPGGVTPLQAGDGAAPDPPMRWWGWGVDRDALHLPASAQRLIEAALGVKEAAAPRVNLAAIELPSSRLDGDVRTRIEAIVGSEGVRDDRLARVAHAAGRSYPDLVRLRSGRVAAPDAVVYPASHDEVRVLLETCAESGVAVVPFGGGTSVVGGVEPDAGSFASASVIDRFGVSRIDVCVGLFAPATAGSSVKTFVKFDPETVPWFVTTAPPKYGLFTVTWNWILTVLPASNVPTECVTVSPPPAVARMPGFTTTPRRVLSCCGWTGGFFTHELECE